MEKNIDVSEFSIRSIIHNLMIGVNHMHSANIIHRDLKLENVFVKFDQDNFLSGQVGWVKIVDLGLSIKSS